MRSVCHWKRCETGFRKHDKKVRKRIKNTPNSRERRPRAAQGQGVAARDVTSESEEDEKEGVEWSKRMYGVRMSPAHPRYVGRGDDTCGGEVVYTIPEIRTLLRSQPEDTTRSTREENEINNEKMWVMRGADSSGSSGASSHGVKRCASGHANMKNLVSFKRHGK